MKLKIIFLVSTVILFTTQISANINSIDSYLDKIGQQKELIAELVKETN